MRHKIGVATVLLCAMLPASTPAAYAADAAHLHPGPWPIWHWRNHQPRQDQLDALHKSDVTPAQAREIDRLYMQLEQGSQKIRPRRRQTR